MVTRLESDRSLKIVISYALFASLWIALADKAAAWLFRDRDPAFLTGTLTGWLFITVTSLLLYAVLRSAYTRTQALLQHKQEAEYLRIAAFAFESHEGIVVTDAASVILRTNRAFSEITGYTPEETLGQTPRMLQSGRHDAEFYRAMWETVRGLFIWHGLIGDQKKAVVS